MGYYNEIFVSILVAKPSTVLYYSSNFDISIDADTKLKSNEIRL